jgi:hypothetical protein
MFQMTAMSRTTRKIIRRTRVSKATLIPTRLIFKVCVLRVLTCIGADVAGRIVVDMTFLRKEGLIKPTMPENGLSGKKYYKVQFELVMIVDGRNLRYEARWPVGEGAQVQGRGQTCIAAAFVPGTK